MNNAGLIAGGVIIFTSMVIFIILFIFLYQKRYYKHLHDTHKLQVQYEQTLLQVQLEIQEQTLKNLSLEIHDNIGQILSLVKLNLNTLVDRDTNTLLQAKVDDTKLLVGKAITDLRDLSRSLHGDKIIELGLQQSISNELKSLQNTGQYMTWMKTSGEPYRLENKKEILLFRIVQESLHNAVKHSLAKTITVNLLYKEKSFQLIIEDDGIGFDKKELSPVNTGIGLTGIQNRAELIGGIFSLHSSNNNGTRISIEIPWNQNSIDQQVES